MPASVAQRRERRAGSPPASAAANASSRSVPSLSRPRLSHVAEVVAAHEHPVWGAGGKHVSAGIVEEFVIAAFYELEREIAIVFSSLGEAR
jgi:hypothetical protein